MNERIEAVHIVVSQSGAGGAWTIAALIGLGVLVAIGGLLGWVRWQCRRDPLASAFASLARGLGLSKRERDAVIELAAQRGVAPAVLLVSGMGAGPQK
jgi:hypothetical protein